MRSRTLLRRRHVSGDAALVGDVLVAAPNSAGPAWAAWSAAWGGVVVAAFINGALHRGYAMAVGEPTATQLSEAVLALLVVPWAFRVEQRHPLPRRRDAVVIGAGWAAATVAFEFMFGHYVNGDSWRTLLAAYDMTDGRLWTMDVLLVAAAPTLARGWHRRGPRTSDRRH